MSSFAEALNESFLQDLQKNYRRAFRSFIEATDELLRCEETEGMNLSQIRAINVRIRDAQAACRDARNRLARFLIARQRERMANRLVPWRERRERLIFLSEVESLLSDAGEFQIVYTSKQLKDSAPKPPILDA